MRLFGKQFPRSREPTTKTGRAGAPTVQKPTEVSRYKMLTTWGEYYYSWNGKLFDSDIVRACIRPKIKAAGKLVGKHLKYDGNGELCVDRVPYIRCLLRHPNGVMTGQQFLEKMAAQLCLNNNAFALIIRDENGRPSQLYPIPAVMAEALYGKDGTLYLRFTYRNGKSGTFLYSDIIHLRQDYGEDDIFGSSPAPALAQLMECVGTIDQGIVKAIKNSGIIRWLLTFTTTMRDEDIKRNVQNFVDNYLSIETDTFGAAGVDARAGVKQIEPKDYVPNATQTDRITERLYSVFNTNKKIVQSQWNEDEWTAYYEAEVEPLAIQLGAELTAKLFTRKEIDRGNQIVFESTNLQCAGMNTKLGFLAMVDRGAMTPNEWRSILNLGPIEGGDQPIRRLDTQVVDMLEKMLGKMNAENCVVMADLMKKLLDTAGKEKLPDAAAKGGERHAEASD